MQTDIAFYQAAAGVLPTLLLANFFAASRLEPTESEKRRLRYMDRRQLLRERYILLAAATLIFLLTALGEWVALATVDRGHGSTLRGALVVIALLGQGFALLLAVWERTARPIREELVSRPPETPSTQSKPPTAGTGSS